MNRVEVYKQLKQLWPQLTLASQIFPGHVWMMDKEYDCPELQAADKLIHWHKPWQFWVSPVYKVEQRDCDDIGRKMAYEVQQAYSGPNPLAFGEIAVTRCKLFFSAKNHLLNVLVCKDGILLYDCQSDVSWTASSDADKPYYVRI